MKRTEVVEGGWRLLETLLPADVNETALRTGAIRRRRQVRDGSTLLRLAMGYAFEGGSLRSTAVWAAAQGIAAFSDVALLKRLRGAAPWLSLVLSEMLAARGRVRVERFGKLRVRVIDATCVSRRGSTGTDWRIHMGWDLGGCGIDELEVTGPEGGETFARHAVQEGDVLLADRGYAHRRGIAAVVSAGGHVVVRINWQNLPLLDAEGVSLDILAAVRHLEAGDVADIPVEIAPDTKRGIPAIAGRLVALRKSEAAAEKARRAIRAAARKKGRTPDARTLEAAAFVLVYTSVPADRLSAAQVMELYRFRWQIELAFKRMKGIMDLDEMAARDPALCRTFLCAKLIGALLVEDLAHALGAFSPWGYGTPVERPVEHVPLRVQADV